VNILEVYAAALDGQGRCADSYQTLLRLMTVVEEPGGDEEAEASALRNLGYFGPYHGRLDAEARQAFQLALDLNQKTFDPGNAEIGWSLIDLAEYHRRADPSAAVALFERGMPILVNAYGADDPTLIKAQVDFASTLIDAPGCDSDRAGTILAQARAVAESTFGPTHPTFGYVLSGIAERHERLGELELAVQEWRQCIAITESVDVNHPDLVDDLDYLAGALGKLGRTEEAQAVRERFDRVRIAHQDLEPRLNFGSLRPS
jgi:tetratricopeptide (TPR) repeat protein